MIVACKSCNTHYNLDESILKSSGSKVRCSKCSHVFVVHPSDALNISEKIKVTEAESKQWIKEVELGIAPYPEAEASEAETELLFDGDDRDWADLPDLSHLEDTIENDDRS